VTSTNSLTFTQTVTNTVTNTHTDTSTGTVTSTATVTRTVTLTSTASSTLTATQSATGTVTKTVTTTITKTMTPTCTITVSPTPSSTALPSVEVKCDYFSYNTSSSTDTIFANIRLYNTDNKDINLSGVKAVYWFTQEGVDTSMVEIDDSRLLPSGNSIRNITFADIYLTACLQNRKMTVSFGNAFLKPGEFVEVHLRIHHVAWQSYNRYNQINDYSFGTQSWFTQWQKITLYYNNSLVWGTEPECAPPGGIVENLMETKKTILALINNSRRKK